MDGKITIGDVAILSNIAEYKFLTAKQLAAITQRAMQVVRRRLRFLKNECYIAVRERGFGGRSGRPEHIIILTEKGMEMLKSKGILSKHAAYVTDKTSESIFIDHDLLVNWFFIHLIQVGKENPCLSTRHLTISSHNLNKGNADKPLLVERFSGEDSENNHLMIPDGVFIITNIESEKSLLFFLEVDMGTETLVNTKRTPNDTQDYQIALMEKIIFWICKFNPNLNLTAMNCKLKAVTHHSAIVYNAMRNSKVRIVSIHPMHPLIFEFHPGQSLPPFEQSAY